MKKTYAEPILIFITIKQDVLETSQHLDIGEWD